MNIIKFQSYRDFHADLYPETAGPVSSFYASQWMAGENRPVAKISLDPAKKQVGLMQVNIGFQLHVLYLSGLILVKDF
jgi:Type of WD40 repeat